MAVASNSPGESSSTVSDYLPFEDRPFRLRMGLHPLDLDTWLEVDEHHDEQLALKRRLVAERHDEVIAEVDDPRVADAQAELWALIESASRDPCRVDGLAPIALCTCSTQEDWVLMVDLGAGPVLGAAGVCFPSRWVLADKIGRSNREIHGPIAHYDDHLAAPVDRFFERLSLDRPMWRLNWNLFDSPELFQPIRAGSAAGAPVPSSEAPAVWLRVERQTLRRLPTTGAVAFGIRVHQRPVTELAGRPADLARLAAAVRGLPRDTFDYKDLGRVADDLLAWIDERVRTT